MVVRQIILKNTFYFTDLISHVYLCCSYINRHHYPIILKSQRWLFSDVKD